LILALVVVVIGGLGSVRGALFGALVIGEIESLGRALLSNLASFVLFGALAVVLVLRPRGLFGAATGART
jgi:branched-chain amino acid transport system permease protein